ncbi:MAG: transcription-repair coupling factor [Muribaculaceae bacterium]|nr:transcription-repair coupling factor [Muribaculaceae bacterium]
MTLTEVKQLFFTTARRRALKSALSATADSAPMVQCCSLAGSSAAMALSELYGMRGTSPVLVVGDSADDAGYLYHDLTRIAGEEAVAMLPSAFRRDIRYGQPDAPSEILRTETLARWHSDHTLHFVVTYPEAMAEKVATEADLTAATLNLRAGEQRSMSDTVKWLMDAGFTRTDYVYEPGQIAVRGSILDIFGFSLEYPLRIDFFGDEIDTIRTFDVQTQLSQERLTQVSVTANVESGSSGETITSFIPDDTLIALRDEAYTIERLRLLGSSSMSANAVIAGESDPDALKRLADTEAIVQALGKFARIAFTASAAPANPRRAIDFHCSPQALYHKNFDLLAQSLTQYMTDGYTICILCESERQGERLKEIFAQRPEDIHFECIEATLHEGFIDHTTHTCVLTDHQIFDRFHKYSLRSERARSGKLALSLKELASIEPGDYVVHIDHGVGKFAGLYRTNVNGRLQEMIKLTYANDDIIFVSIHSLHKLSKYRGKEGEPPRINKLGSGAWNRIKERTKSKLKDIARDLIQLYATRCSRQGFSFSPDSYMQHELEASFIYEDTPDQLTATKAVKADMESPRPMDRLICGDVGFGKTEVAIRAAFKAAIDGKQTAVLVPTTVLAYQHFRTFSQRLADFPVKVEYLSRARTAKQTRQILTDLAEGKIDILIGTHKLVGNTVKFKDLGLLIIDEEQKFGVAVKEKLKQMKTNVDTLTMSATPIPRTLQFSLMGARDLSAITTPPPNRYPIYTSLCALTDEMVAEAVGFEMARGGQVFVINDRIEGLAELETMIRRLVPDARLAVAHGKMPPEQLEKAIIDFTNHDYDILLATTIVESGVDMPNVNTIIINNAHNFGLSELHQLRGRVGRSNRKAFCYLTVPPAKPLTAIARRRLQAIENFSDLGSGIHIAMQDLDIRGAGNLLGAEQSGFIADLGYETYQKILREAVTELRTEEFPELAAHDSSAAPPDEQGADDFVADCVIESDMELLLPADYVPQDSQRISLYQELDSIERELDLKAFRDRLLDRFGQLPPEAEELLRIPRLRRLARKLGIEKVALKQGEMYIYFVDESNKAYYQSPMFGRLLHFLQQNPAQCRIRDKGGRRSFAIRNVKSVQQAVDLLGYILQLSPL